MSLNLLSLDFDGVLHRASDSVLLNFRPGAAPWELEMGLKAQKRFVWSSILEDALEGSDVAIIIHSTWRKRYDDATMKHFLPPGLARRLISLDGQIEGRKSMIGDNYLAAAIDLLEPQSVCVLDDRKEFFSGGRVAAWLANNHGSFVWCDGEMGVQQPACMSQLRTWLHSTPDQQHRHGPQPTQAQRCA